MSANSPVDSSASPDRVGPGRILLFSAIFFGLAVTEEVSNNVLPLTLQRITDGFSLTLNLPIIGELSLGSAFVIGLILALNPAFGFIAQPLVGLISDRVWTRVGRRAFFLIIGAPVVAACLLSIPFVTLVWQIVVVVLIYQFFQDVLWGSDHPLLADLFPSRQRGRVLACTVIAYQAGAVFVNWIGLSWLDAHAQANDGRLFGLPIYSLAAAIQVVFVMGLAFFLWEKKYTRPAPKISFTSYFQDFWAQPGLFRMGMINFLRAFMNAAATGFLVLFGTKTLGFEITEYSQAIGLLPFLTLLYIWVVGMAADRMRRDWFLIIGFAVSGLGYLIGASAHSLVQLAVAFVVFKFAWAIIEIGYKSLVTDFYPREMIGQMAGAINIFYALGRTMAMVLVGAVVGLFGDDYRVAWYIAVLFALISILVMLGAKDPRPPRAQELAAGQ